MIVDAPPDRESWAVEEKTFKVTIATALLICYFNRMNQGWFVNKNTKSKIFRLRKRKKSQISFAFAFTIEACIFLIFHQRKLAEGDSYITVIIYLILVFVSFVNNGRVELERA